MDFLTQSTRRSRRLIQLLPAISACSALVMTLNYTLTMDRRKFIQLPLAGIPLILVQKAAGQKPEITSSGKFAMPLVVSTWDSGITANKAAWPILQKGGRALDAVEAAGRASEDE